MSKNDMVLVSRERLEQWQKTALEWKIDSIGTGIMSVLTEQHQGEPVAWLDPAAGLSWLVDRMTVAPGTKLYTRADPGEVERLRAGVAKFRGYCVDLDSEKRELEHKMDAYKGAAEQAVTLRAKLAERDELLRTVLEAFEGAEGHPWMPGHVAVKIKPMVAAALSASAEPQQNQTKE